MLILLPGCDSSGLGRLVPVQGTVTLNGKPLTTGSLVFKPDASKDNKLTVEPAGEIGADGKYTLFTAGQAGAPLGWYKVAVVAQEINQRDPYAPARSLIPVRYNDPSTSGLDMEVVESPGPGAYDISLAK